MNEETELKLRVPEGAVTSLRRSPVLTALRQRRGSRRQLFTVYYDTPSLALAKKGMGVKRIDLLATAAVRDASNGKEFVRNVEKVCRQSVQILSGEEEARLSAMPAASGLIRSTFLLSRYAV